MYIYIYIYIGVAGGEKKKNRKTVKVKEKIFIDVYFSLYNFHNSKCLDNISFLSDGSFYERKQNMTKPETSINMFFVSVCASTFVCVCVYVC